MKIKNTWPYIAVFLFSACLIVFQNCEGPEGHRPLSIPNTKSSPQSKLPCAEVDCNALNSNSVDSPPNFSVPLFSLRIIPNSNLRAEVCYVNAKAQLLCHQWQLGANDPSVRALDATEYLTNENDFYLLKINPDDTREARRTNLPSFYFNPNPSLVATYNTTIKKDESGVSQRVLKNCVLFENGAISCMNQELDLNQAVPAEPIDWIDFPNPSSKEEDSWISLVLERTSTSPFNEQLCALTQSGALDCLLFGATPGEIERQFDNGWRKNLVSNLLSKGSLGSLNFANHNPVQSPIPDSLPDRDSDSLVIEVPPTLLGEGQKSLTYLKCSSSNTAQVLCQWSFGPEEVSLEIPTHCTSMIGAPKHGSNLQCDCGQRPCTSSSMRAPATVNPSQNLTPPPLSEPSKLEMASSAEPSSPLNSLEKTNNSLENPRAQSEVPSEHTIAEGLTNSTQPGLWTRGLTWDSTCLSKKDYEQLALKPSDKPEEGAPCTQTLNTPFGNLRYEAHCQPADQIKNTQCSMGDQNNYYCSRLTSWTCE